MSLIIVEISAELSGDGDTRCRLVHIIIIIIIIIIQKFITPT